MRRTWTHRSNAGCDSNYCYCVDELGDPMCDCGNPSFACRCEEERRAEAEPTDDHEAGGRA